MANLLLRCPICEGAFPFIKAIDLKIPDAGTTPILIDSDKNSTRVYTANTGSNDFSIIRTSDDTEVFPGHWYSAPSSAPLGAITETNYVYRPRSKEQWLAMFGMQ